ncbi:MAG TPA: hypothetical protein VGM18_16900 [Candidatus Sulfotelmatobacter sp.]|jgi:hypothetical protein
MTVEIIGAEVLGQASTRETVRPEVRSVFQPGYWNPEHFEREQIHGLVRQVFFSSAERIVRQVVFSAVDAETDVKSLCLQVGEALAVETAGTVAIVGDYRHVVCPGAVAQAEMQDHTFDEHGIAGSEAQRQSAIRARSNLWLVPAGQGNDGDRGKIALAQETLRETRTTFEYSIVEGPPAGEWNGTMAMAQFADGIILVLSAQHTRRATARKMKETLDGAHVRILGTVLRDRVFPIPQGIYRRL